MLIYKLGPSIGDVVCVQKLIKSYKLDDIINTNLFYASCFAQTPVCLRAKPTWHLCELTSLFCKWSQVEKHEIQDQNQFLVMCFSSICSLFLDQRGKSGGTRATSGPKPLVIKSAKQFVNLLLISTSLFSFCFEGNENNRDS